MSTLIAQPFALLREIERLRSRIATLEANQAGQTSQVGQSGIYSGIGDPNSVITATGPAFYFDNTDPMEPVIWLKSTSGTADDEWFLLSIVTNSEVIITMDNSVNNNPIPS